MKKLPNLKFLPRWVPVLCIFTRPLPAVPHSWMMKALCSPGLSPFYLLSDVTVNLCWSKRVTMHRATLICAVLLYLSMHNYSANWSEVNATVLASQGKCFSRIIFFLPHFLTKHPIRMSQLITILFLKIWSSLNSCILCWWLGGWHPIQDRLVFKKLKTLSFLVQYKVNKSTAHTTQMVWCHGTP